MENRRPIIELLRDLRVVVASEHPRTLLKYSNLFSEITKALGISPARDTALAYFISGSWKIGHVRHGQWKDTGLPDYDVSLYGGSHAGQLYKKVFISSKERLIFVGRMLGIYGDRFWCRGDDASEQRFMHFIRGGWEA